MVSLLSIPKRFKKFMLNRTYVNTCIRHLNILVTDIRIPQLKYFVNLAVPLVVICGKLLFPLSEGLDFSIFKSTYWTKYRADNQNHIIGIYVWIVPTHTHTPQDKTYTQNKNRKGWHWH